MSDVVDLITADHREVERLFEVLKSQPDQRSLVLPTLTALLIAHSRAEEAEVYPVARSEAGETDEVAHSQEEHARAEELLEKLRKTQTDDARFESILTELVDAVQHHVQEEENTVLAGMRERLDEQRLRQLAEAFAAAREEHLGERPGEATREDLLEQARNAGLEGAASMSKEELARALKP